MGHFGTVKTCERIEASGMWWIGIEQDAKAIVSRCAACSRDAAHRVQSHAALSIPIPHGVWDRVHMDLLQLPESQSGFHYIILFVDALSKFPVAFPLKTKEMTGIALCLWQLIALFGAPVAIHSDNGAEFVNEVVHKMASIHGIDQRFSTAYRPQGNGQVERFNRTIQSVLRKCTGDTQDM